jgi:PadR family transcriptional regulator PadR
MNSQYKKGVLELCVLSLLSKEDRYGYDVAEYLSRHIEIADGTVYPILRKLKSEGFVTTYLSEESGGPPRKYYTLTKSGREAYETQKDDWLAFAESIKNLVEGDNVNG